MLVEAVVAAFVLTQLCYALVNCGLVGRFLRRRPTAVDERTLGRALETAENRGERRGVPVRADDTRRYDGDARVPADSVRVHADGGNEGATEIDHGPGPRCRLPAGRRRRIHAFVAVDPDGRNDLQRTLASLATQSYPVDEITVYAVRASSAGSTLDRNAVDAVTPADLEVVLVETDPDATSEGRADPAESAIDRWFAGSSVTREQAGAVAAALSSRPLADDDAVTVLAAGTTLPVDTFELSVAGLEEYDIVQPKRTTGNIDDGMLPLLESTWSAAWSDLDAAGPRPYHLVGPGVVTEAGVVRELERWCRDSGEPLPLGAAASRRGYSLGVVDRYVRERCPVGLGDWIRRTRRRVRAPYRYPFARGWRGFDDVRFWTGPFLAHSAATIGVVGLPAAATVALLYGGGSSAASFSAPVRLLVGFNALVWAYFGARAYRAAWDGVSFRSVPHKLAYSILSNPVTQALYTALTAVPIWLAIADVVRRTVRSK